MPECLGWGAGVRDRKRTTRMSGFCVFRARSGAERGTIYQVSLALGTHHLLLRG